MDDVFTLTNSISETFIVNENLEKYAQQDYSEYYVVFDLYNKLKTFSSQCAYLDADIGFSNISDNFVVSVSGTQKFTEYLTAGGVYSVSADEILSRLENEKYVALDGKNNLIIISKMLLRTGIHTYSIISLNKNSLCEGINQNDDYGFYLFDNKNRIMRYSTNVPEKADEIVEAYLANNKFIDDYWIYRNVLQNKNWEYVYFVSGKIMKSNVKKAIYFAIGIGISLEIIGLFLIYLSSKKIYMPVRRLLGIFSDWDKDEESDEFSYLMNSFNELKIRNLNYEEIIASTAYSVKSKAIENIIKGLVPMGSVSDIIEKNNIEIFSKEIVLIHITINFFDKKLSHDQMCVLQEQITKIIRNSFKKDMLSCEILNLDLTHLLVFSELPSDKTAELFLKINTILEERCYSSLRCIIGNPVLGVEAAREEYEKLLFAAEGQISNNIINYLNKINHDNLPNFFYPLEVEREIISSVVSGNLAEAIAALDKCIKINFLQWQWSHTGVTFLNSIFLSSVIRIIQIVKCEKSTEVMLGLKKIKASRTLEELQAAMEDIFEKIIHDVTTRSDLQEKKIIEDIVSIINKEYNKDWALSEFARMFNISQSYLSALFKKITGNNFKDYINTIKTIKAKEMMLENPELKIKDISDMLGFNTTNTFIRVFKRYEGVSPGKFKEQHKG